MIKLHRLNFKIKTIAITKLQNLIFNINVRVKPSKTNVNKYI